MMPAQFDDRSDGLCELPDHGGDCDARRVAMLHEPGLRLLLRASADLTGESLELLVAVADRLRVVERLANGATAELY